MKKISWASLGLVVASVLGLVSTPANALDVAPTLPRGSKLLAVDCNRNRFQIWDIDVTSGDSTPVGVPVTPTLSNCGSSGAVNPVDGTVYYIAWHFSGNALVSVDPTTGISETVAIISGDADSGHGLAIDANGNAYTEMWGNLYSLNLTSGVTTLIGNTGLNDKFSFAFNPVDGKIYWFTDQGTQRSDVYTVDPLTATPTLVTPALDLSALNGYHPDSLNFDSNGIAWVQDDNCDGPGGSCGIEAVNVTTGQVWPPVYQNDVTLTVVPAGGAGKGYFYTQGLIFVPGPSSQPNSASKKVSVYFDANSAVLTNEAKSLLRRKINSIPESARIRQVIITSFVAGSISWPQLAERRATAVKKYIAKRDVSARFVLKPQAAGAGLGAFYRRADIEFRYVPSVG